MTSADRSLSWLALGLACPHIVHSCHKFFCLARSAVEEPFVFSEVLTIVPRRRHNNAKRLVVKRENQRRMAAMRGGLLGATVYGVGTYVCTYVGRLQYCRWPLSLLILTPTYIHRLCTEVLLIQIHTPPSNPTKAMCGATKALARQTDFQITTGGSGRKQVGDEYREATLPRDVSLAAAPWNRIHRNFGNDEQKNNEVTSAITTTASRRTPTEAAEKVMMTHPCPTWRGDLQGQLPLELYYPSISKKRCSSSTSASSRGGFRYLEKASLDLDLCLY
jgi:hypothetical protein